MSQTSAQLLADSLGNSSTGTIPVGGIVLWSGSIATIPDGWKLCDGNNDTPDLRNRFVVGAGNYNSNNYPNLKPNATPGGSANAVLIAHNHEISPIKVLSTEGQDNTILRGATSGTPLDYNVRTSSDIVGKDNTGADSNSQTGTNANLPPYYALAYIMRTS